VVLLALFNYSRGKGVRLQIRRCPSDQGFREESFSNTGDINGSGPAAGRKKTDFEDDIGGFGV
jgi:hypothetical protein